MSNLLKRCLSGAVYVLVMLGGAILHPYVFALIFAALLFFTQYEFFGLSEKAGYKPLKYTTAILGVLFFLVNFGIASGIIPNGYAFLFIPVLAVLFFTELFRKESNALINSGLNLLGFCYIALPFSLMNFVVHSSVGGAKASFYPWILVGVMFILWVNDSFAYLTGSAFGKHKMCPAISPKKSWEGLIGGAVFAVVMGILNAVMFQAVSMTSWIVIALITVAFGTVGDLFESKIKREIGIKDSGNVLPGHGGFLDRLDSLLFAIPAVFFWLMISGNI